MSSYSDYADAVSRIIQSGADAQANALRQKGQLWGSALSNLGLIPQQVLEARRQERADQLAQSREQRLQAQEDLQLETAKDAKQAKVDEATRKKAVAGILKAAPTPFMATRMLQNINAPEEAAQVRQDAIDQAALTLAKADESNWDQTIMELPKYLGPSDELTPEYPGDDWKRNHLTLMLPDVSKDTRSGIEAYLKQTEPAKADSGFTLSPGQTRFDAQGQPIASSPESERPATTTDYRTFLQGWAAEHGTTINQMTGSQHLQARKAWAQADDRPQPSRSQAQIDDLVDTVLENPALWDQLTPTVRGQIAPALHQRGYTNFGKPLSEAAMTKIAESNSAVDSLKDLRDVLKANEQYIGPIAGLSAYNPYSDARKAQANIDLVRQRVGKALEGGVLRKEDEEKYKKILATLQDTPETAIYKVDQIIKNITDNVENFKNQQRLGGRNLNMSGASSPEKSEPAAPVSGRIGPWTFTVEP